MIAALVLVPVLAGFGVLLLPRRAEESAKWIGAVVALATLVVAALSANAPDESVRWLSRPFTASFHVGLHGLGYWLVLLLALVTLCGLVVTRLPRERSFVAQMLLLLGTMTGVFVARDLLLFALFWDLMLIPVFLVLVGWGPAQAGRQGPPASAWRYLIYNVAGGLALLLAMAAYGVLSGSTDVLGAASPPTGVPPAYLPWIFAGFAFAFLVKTPTWPFHTWMPSTYSDLPPPMVAVVSAVQSKAGLYGFIVVGLALMPHVMKDAAPLMITLGVVALLYGALIALTQSDVKRIVAYSSLSHLGLIVIALFAFYPAGAPNAIAIGGAAVYIIAHGLFSAALFLVLGALEQREETRTIERLGGLGARNPRLAGAFTIAALAALGLPGLAGFAGEILIITGIYHAGYLWASIVVLVPIVIAAAYLLRLFQDAMQGPERPDLPQRPDLTLVEGLALAPLLLALVLLGVNPAPLANPAGLGVAEQTTAASGVLDGKTP